MTKEELLELQRKTLIEMTVFNHFNLWRYVDHPTCKADLTHLVTGFSPTYGSDTDPVCEKDVVDKAYMKSKSAKK